MNQHFCFITFTMHFIFRSLYIKHNSVHVVQKSHFWHDMVYTWRHNLWDSRFRLLLSLECHHFTNLYYALHHEEILGIPKRFLLPVCEVCMCLSQVEFSTLSTYDDNIYSLISFDDKNCLQIIITDAWCYAKIKLLLVYSCFMYHISLDIISRWICNCKNTECL